MNDRGIPYRNIPSIEEIGDLTKELMDSAGPFINDMIKLREKNAILPGLDGLSPDPFGCEQIFLLSFIERKMEDDFLLIARDFYAHEFANLSSYEDTPYYDVNSGADWPNGMFNRFTLNLMMNAVNSGSKYSKALILHLYKTYYRYEYKILKRFQSLSASDLLSIAQPTKKHYLVQNNLARILYISKLMGIRIKEDCDYIFAYLNDLSDQVEASRHYEYDISDIVEDCTKELETKYDMQTLYTIDADVSRFLENVFHWLGYYEGYADLCDDGLTDLTQRWAYALAFLKKTSPNREITPGVLATYAALFHCASALTTGSDYFAERLQVLLLGEELSYSSDGQPPLFKPEEVDVPESPVKRSPHVSGLVQKHLANSEDIPSSTKDIVQQELERLRRKVHKLEGETIDLRVRLKELEQAEVELKRSRDQLDVSKRELAALRDYVHKLKDEDTLAPEISIEQMKEELSNQQIVIIGGHPNWQSKLKKAIPDLICLGPDASGTTDPKIVDKADKVFFFTDTIGHSKYHQFINVIRERKVSFGYLHSVNLDKSIREMYRQMIKG